MPANYKEMLALMELLKEPGLSDAEVAKRVGCCRTSLYRMPRYRKARAMQSTGRKSLPRGYKKTNSDASGVSASVEDWREAE